MTKAPRWLMDTPGMCEVQITGAAAGLDSVFADIAALAESCRFGDCRHDSEPGCAVNAAIAEGKLEPGRVRRWRKLVTGEAYNNASLAERRDRAFGRMAKSVITAKHDRREK